MSLTQFRSTLLLAGSHSEHCIRFNSDGQHCIGSRSEWPISAGGDSSVCQSCIKSIELWNSMSNLPLHRDQRSGLQGWTLPHNMWLKLSDRRKPDFEFQLFELYSHHLLLESMWSASARIIDSTLFIIAPLASKDWCLDFAKRHWHPCWSWDARLNDSDRKVLLLNGKLVPHCRHTIKNKKLLVRHDHQHVQITSTWSCFVSKVRVATIRASPIELSLGRVQSTPIFIWKSPAISSNSECREDDWQGISIMTCSNGWIHAGLGNSEPCTKMTPLKR